MPKKAKNINKNKNKNVNKNVVNIKIHNNTKRRRNSKPKKALQGNAPPTNGYASFSPQISVYPQLPQYPPQMVGGYYRDAVMPTQTSSLADFTIPRSQSIQTQKEIQVNVETPTSLSEKLNEEFKSGFKTSRETPPPFNEDPSPIASPPFSASRSFNNLDMEVLQPKPTSKNMAIVNGLALKQLKEEITDDEFNSIKYTKFNIPYASTKYGKRFINIRNELIKQGAY